MKLTDRIEIINIDNIEYMIDYTLALINIDLTINKMLFRLKLEDLSEKKRKGIETIIEDLKVSSELVKMQNKAIEEQFQINSKLYLENLKLKRIV
jgi:hypothetical protein